MKKKILFIIAIQFNYLFAISETIDTLILNSFNEKDKISLSESFGGKEGVRSISFLSSGSFVTYGKISNVKTLNFEYYGIVTDDFNLIFSIKEKGTNDFQVLQNESKRKIIPNTIMPLTISISKFGEYDIKIEVVYSNQGSGVFGIANLNLDKYSTQEIKDFNDRVRRDKEYELKLNVIYDQKTADNYNLRVDNIKLQYQNQITRIRDIQIKANTMSALASTVQLVNKRTLMSDPSQYAIFSQKIDFVRSIADSTQSIYLDNIVESFRSKEINLPINPTKKEGFRKFSMIAGDVVNLVTAGQFKGIVNSLQGLIGTLFSKGNLESKLPVLKYEFNNDQKVTRTTLNRVNRDSIRVLVAKGLELQKFFTVFFTKLDSNRNNFKEIVQDFQYFSNEADPFVNLVDEIHNNFYQLPGVSIDEKIYYSNPDDAYYSKIKSQADKYFDGLKIKDKVKRTNEVSSHENELIQINKVLQEIDVLDEESIRLSSNLSNLFAIVEEDLKRPNPFGIPDSRAPGRVIANPLFGNSFDEYNTLNNEALAVVANIREKLSYILGTSSL
ncbi:MAG: hypothetical protein WAU36_15085 [Cyclobacteriaceae bacterium]